MLERAADAADETHDQIAADERHDVCRLLLRKDVDEPEFDDWSMAVVDPAAAASALHGYLD